MKEQEDVSAPIKLVEIPYHVRVMLARMDEEDVEKFEEALALVDRMKTLGWFGKHLFLLTVAIIGGLGTIIIGWDAIKSKIGAG